MSGSRRVQLPAGYSVRWLRQILRGQMGYRGVVFSDDLGMHAAKAVGDLVERSRRCLEAGCDLALVCDPEDAGRLLGDPDAPVADASALLARLYGRATVDRDGLAAVREEGIREWGHWQRSLESMNPSERGIA